MFQRRSFHVALVAALLLAQFELPAAHGFKLFEEGAAPVVVGADSLHAASPVSPHGATHDAARCPICLALAQVRSGVDRLAPLAAPGSPSLFTPLAPPPVAAAARTFARVSAPPRAPPLLAHSLA